jgi:hypothetical protein
MIRGREVVSAEDGLGFIRHKALETYSVLFLLLKYNLSVSTLQVREDYLVSNCVSDNKSHVSDGVPFTRQE